jgi:hypothetical protein
MTAISDDDRDALSVAFSARLAVLMAGGDESGTRSLTSEFMRACTGAAGPELEPTPVVAQVSSVGTYPLLQLHALPRPDRVCHTRILFSHL